MSAEKSECIVVAGGRFKMASFESLMRGKNCTGVPRKEVAKEFLNPAFIWSSLIRIAQHFWAKDACLENTVLLVEVMNLYFCFLGLKIGKMMGSLSEIN